jgi:hypothetical protein
MTAMKEDCLLPRANVDESRWKLFQLVLWQLHDGGEKSKSDLARFAAQRERARVICSLTARAKGERRAAEGRGEEGKEKRKHVWIKRGAYTTYLKHFEPTQPHKTLSKGRIFST